MGSKRGVAHWLKCSLGIHLLSSDDDLAFCYLFKNLSAFILVKKSSHRHNFSTQTQFSRLKVLQWPTHRRGSLGSDICWLQLKPRKHWLLLREGRRRDPHTTRLYTQVLIDVNKSMKYISLTTRRQCSWPHLAILCLSHCFSAAVWTCRNTGPNYICRTVN